MTSFAPVDEYVEYYNLTVTDELLVRASVDLDAACDTIRDYCGQTITAVTSDTFTTYGNDRAVLILPELPVTAVTAVTENGTAVTDWTFDGPDGLLLRSDASGYASSWSRSNRYVITYSHGYTPELLPTIYKVCAFQLVNAGATGAPAGVIQESVAGYSVTYATPPAGATDSPILAILGRRRQRKTPVA